MCVISLCTRGALDTWSRGRSTAALGVMLGGSALFFSVRWFVTGSAVVAGLWFLNAAFFSAWQTATPSGSEHTNVWAYSAYKAFGYSIALLCAAALAALNLRPGRSRVRSLWSVVILLCLLGALLWPRWWHFWEVDGCLDAGGAWDEAYERCEGARFDVSPDA